MAGIKEITAAEFLQVSLIVYNMFGCREIVRKVLSLRYIY